MKKILYLLIMIVSLSFIVSASPQMLRPFKLLKPPPPKPPKIPTINLRGINIPTRIVDERGRNFNPRRKGYESPIVVTINPPRTKVLTAPKIPGPSPVTDKRFLESQKKSLIHRHLFNNPLMRNLGSFPKENYKKTLFFSEEIAEWIHSAEVYHTLLELLEAIFELGSDSDSDSSDDSDEDGYVYSDTIVVDSTKAVQVVLYLKPINLQQ